MIHATFEWTQKKINDPANLDDRSRAHTHSPDLLAEDDDPWSSAFWFPRGTYSVDNYTPWSGDTILYVHTKPRRLVRLNSIHVIPEIDLGIVLVATQQQRTHSFFWS